MKKTIAIIFILALIIGCTKQIEKYDSQETQVDDINTNDITENTNVKEITIEGSSYRFNPNIITVNKGDLVKINFVNTEGKHDLRIEGYNIGTKVINSGEKDVLEFKADKTGEYEYYCSVGQHRQMGMKGKLVVK